MPAQLTDEVQDGEQNKQDRQRERKNRTLLCPTIIGRQQKKVEWTNTIQLHQNEGNRNGNERKQRKDNEKPRIHSERKFSEGEREREEISDNDSTKKQPMKGHG